MVVRVEQRYFADHKFSIVNRAFLTMVFLTSLVFVMFAVFDYTNLLSRESARNLREVQNDASRFGNILDQRAQRAEVAAEGVQIQRLAMLPETEFLRTPQTALDRSLSYLRTDGFRSISIIRSDGLIIQSGVSLPSGAKAIQISGRVPTGLMIADGFYLETAHILKDAGGRVLGRMIAQQRIPALDDVMRQDLTRSRTSDLLLCWPSGGGALCVSSRHGLQSTEQLNARDGRMSLLEAASRGWEASGIWVRSPESRLMAAAIPAKRSGLVLLGSSKMWAVLVPVMQETGGTFLALSALLFLGRYLLRKRVRPLVVELMAQMKQSQMNEQRFIAAAESSLNALFLFESMRDEQGTIVDFRFIYLNERAEALIQRTSADVCGKALCVELPINRTGGFFEKYRQVVETGEPLNEVRQIDTPAIAATWLEYQVVRLGDGVALTASDVSSRKEMELKVEQALAFARAVVDASSFSTIVTDLDGTILAVNPATERMLWYKQAEMVGKMTPLAIHDAAEVRQRAEEYTQHFGYPVAPTIEVFTAKAKQGLTDEGEWTYVRKDSSRLPVCLTTTALRDDQGVITGYMGTAYDITERKRQEDYISHIAHHDALTGLPTRTLFRDRVDGALGRITRYGGVCAVMLIDLDNFKDVNDSLGHSAGDEVLVTVSQRIASVLRKTDTVSRMGGDEFTVLLDRIESEEDVVAIAKKILAELAKATRIGSDELHLSASIGISVYPEGGVTSTVLLKNADAAMYFAKEHGKEGYRVFTKGLADANVRRMQIETGLKKGLEAGEFSVVYQPQVSLVSGELVGVEALVRWRSEKLGTVSPAEFIPLAEQCGVIGPLGEWVLETACREIRSIWKATGKQFRLAVNLSPRQLEREGLGDFIAKVLRQEGFAPEMLEIEITEGVLMSDSLAVWELLREIQAQGVRVAIDDFGIGFSNVAYLLKLEVNRIKIDRSFIAKLETDAGSLAVVSSMISMAGDLGVAVIAEGVETDGQREILMGKGCAEAQGYLFHRPMDPQSLLMTVFAKEMTVSGSMTYLDRGRGTPKIM